MTDTPLTPHDEDEALAAELALGLLDGDEAAVAVARLSSDPAFAQSVLDWQERLAELAENLTPVMAPARARQAIRERLGHAVAPLSVDPNARMPWWRGPFGLIAGLLAVAVLAAILILPGLTGRDVPGVASDPDFLARLVSEDQNLQVAAYVKDRQMEIALERGPAASGRDYEIWWITPDAQAISIGIVPRQGNLSMTLPEGLDPSERISIALSDEPEGGSPTGQATGPVVAIAPLTSL
ncbi:MAG: anti-sigma factor [Paracoccus sp. (in: a-proteobacteria)]|nr:anti-sigma factor [Paracoccus sp. (in: a-proteobacteria)]